MASEVGDRGTAEDGSWENISDMAMHWADVRPEAPALYEGHATIDWRTLGAHVRAAALELRQRGVKEDESIGIALGNSSELIIALLAAMRIGAIPLVMSPRLAEDALTSLVGKFALSAIVVEAIVDRKLAPITINLAPGWRPQPVPSGTDARSVRTADQNQAAILSSGSSGEPRAHVNTQRKRMMRAAGRLIAHPQRWSAERTGVLVLTGSLASAMQQDSFLTQLTIGGPTAIGPLPATPGDLARSLGAWDGAICVLNPNQCRALLRCAVPERLVLPRAQLMRIGGEMMSADEKRAMLQRVTPNFCESYGSAGTGTITVAQPEEVAAKPETVGRPFHGVEIQIVDENDRPVPANVIGRIRVRGRLVGGGFLAADGGDPAAPETYRDGWVYPGDMGALDTDGFLILKGRLGERIVQNGAAVFAAEIEAGLSAIEGVSEVAVVKRSAASGAGDEAVAFVVKRTDLSHDALRASLAARLPPGKVPPLIFYIEQLPRSPAGKIDRQALRRFAMQPQQVNRR